LGESIDEVLDKALVLPEGDKLFKGLPMVGRFRAATAEATTKAAH